MHRGLVDERLSTLKKGSSSVEKREERTRGTGARGTIEKNLRRPHRRYVRVSIRVAIFRLCRCTREKHEENRSDRTLIDAVGVVIPSPSVPYLEFTTVYSVQARGGSSMRKITRNLCFESLCSSIRIESRKEESKICHRTRFIWRTRRTRWIDFPANVPLCAWFSFFHFL